MNAQDRADLERRDVEAHLFKAARTIRTDGIEQLNRLVGFHIGELWSRENGTLHHL